MVLGADFSTTGTANVDSGLTFAIAANRTYRIEAYLLLRAAAVTTGPRPGVSWPTCADGACQITAPNSNTALAFRAQGARTTQNAASTDVPTTTDSYLGIVQAVVVAGPTPAGQFTITLASEVAGSQVTLRAGSFLLYTEVV